MRLIDADAVLERIEWNCDARCLYKDYKEPLRSKMCNCCELGDARMYVEDAPIVDTERHGHWFDEEVEEAGGIYTYTRCSVCGEYALCDSVGQIIETSYCPWCGAKMEGVEE